MAREIRIEPYNPAWKDHYTQTEHVLRTIFNDLIVDIQHIGSTSIEGLSAKPIIDILIVVNNIEDVDSFNDPMSAHGFLAKGEYGIPGRRYFSKTLSSDPFVSTHHVHMYQIGNPKYQEELLFRDYLRIDEGTLRAYEALKIEFAERFRHDP
jgi:GrpB-like predicted nucleotidyltransferase (UPF0157 family)